MLLFGPESLLMKQIKTNSFIQFSFVERLNLNLVCMSVCCLVVMHPTCGFRLKNVDPAVMKCISSCNLEEMYDTR